MSNKSGEGHTSSLLSDTKAPATAPIELKKKQNSKGDDQKKKKQIYIEGAAMFKEDKLVGWLTRKEARGLNVVVMPSEVKGPIIIKSPLRKKRITIEVIKVKSNLEPKLEKGNFKMKVKVKAEGNIAEALTRNYKIITKNNLDRLNKRFAQVIRNEIINAVHKSKKYRADIFGFGETINNKYPQQFKRKKDKWNQIYASLPVDIEVKADIRRFGMIEEGTGTYK